MRGKFCNTYGPKGITLFNNWACDPVNRKEFMLVPVNLAHCLWLGRPWTREENLYCHFPQLLSFPYAF